MTVIAARPGKGGIVMAADSMYSYGESKYFRADKLRRVGGLVIGGAGMTSGLQSVLGKWPDIKRKMPLEDWLISYVAKIVRELPADTEVEFLVTDGTDICVVGGTGEVILSPGFAAIGSGGDFALGAMWGGAEPEEAVRAACELCESCGGDVVSMLVGK